MPPEPEPERLPDGVKPILAVIWKARGALQESVRILAGRWGGVDFVGSDHPFDLTGYYAEEMGSPLLRRIVSFAGLIEPAEIVERKLVAVEVEQVLRGPTGRTVNLDVGYLDLHKLVLASVKSGPQKISLGRGVWADMVSRYSKGAFHAFEWSFPDFRDARYQKDLLAIRELYKAALRRASLP